MQTEKNRLHSDRAAPQHIPSDAYCCFRQDLTGFTPKDRTGPNLHRANGKEEYSVFLPEKQARAPCIPVFFCISSGEILTMSRAQG